MKTKRQDLFDKLEKYIGEDNASDWDGMSTPMLEIILNMFILKEKYNEINWELVLRNWQTDDDGVPDDSELYFKLQELVEKE